MGLRAESHWAFRGGGGGKVLCISAHCVCVCSPVEYSLSHLWLPRCLGTQGLLLPISILEVGSRHQNEACGNH